MVNARRKIGACLVVGLLCLAFGAQAGDNTGGATINQNPGKNKAPADENLAEVKVRLRLIAIETAAHLKIYERSFAAIKEQDERTLGLPELEQRTQFHQNVMAKAKKNLVELETEKAKLTKQLGASKLDGGTDALLERILERLNSIDKRLEKMGR